MQSKPRSGKTRTGKAAGRKKAGRRSETPPKRRRTPESIAETATKMPGRDGTMPVSVAVGHAGNRVEVAFRVGPDEALAWSLVLRNRRRWIDSTDLRSRQAERMVELLRGSCLGDAVAFDTLLRCLREVPVVEVAGPAPTDSEEPGASARDDSWLDLPWEYAASALAGATRAPRAPKLTVLRRIDRAAKREPTRTPIETVLFVASAPGAIGDEFEFESEQDLVHSGLDPTGRFVALLNPSLAELRAQIADVKPDAIHFAGIDVHQGRRLLDIDPVHGDFDGMYFADADGAPSEASASAIANALRAAGQNLRLTSFNIYNSAARTAPLAVVAGSAGAIGFQDEVDDRLAELFFGELYLLWRHEGVLLQEAFEAARQILSDRGTRLRGSGVVLYGARPWIVETLPKRREAVASIAMSFREARGGRRGKDRVVRVDATTVRGSADQAMIASQEAALRKARVSVDAAAEVKPPRKSLGAGDGKSAVELKFKVVPAQRLNYSTLHNRRPIFEEFVIQRPVGAANEEIRLEVALHAGVGETFPFRRTIALTDAVHDLHAEIRLPLVSPLWWSIRESVHTTISVRAVRPSSATVTKETELYYRTFGTTLLPLDEWRDTDEDRVWLPSFVLPRDQAVLRVVESGQRYLMAFADDRTAGFDGYQSYDESLEDPWEGIDDQARSLWYALVHDHPLKYVNPPPTFTELSQRLRRPAEILGGRRGTCIDLALLYAACLEFVEIHPVIFLIEGHAFPGYWRNENAHDAFMLGIESRASRRRSRGVPLQPFPWTSDQSHYAELRAAIDDGGLVPIETVTLTGTGSFQEAVEEGQVNLRNPGEFLMMLDIALARRAGVTPLPMDGGEP